MLVPRLATKMILTVPVAGALLLAQPLTAASQQTKGNYTTAPVIQRRAPVAAQPVQPHYGTPVQQPGPPRTLPVIQRSEPTQPSTSQQTVLPGRTANPYGDRGQPPTKSGRGNPESPGETRNPIGTVPTKPGRPIGVAPRPEPGNPTRARQPPFQFPVRTPFPEIPPTATPPADTQSANAPTPASPPAADPPVADPPVVDPPATHHPVATMPPGATNPSQQPPPPPAASGGNADTHSSTAPPPPPDDNTTVQPDHPQARPAQETPVMVRVWIPAGAEGRLENRAAWFLIGLALLVLLGLAAGWLQSKYRQRSLRSSTISKWHAAPRMDPGAQWIATVSDPVGPVLGVQVTQASPVVELSWVKPKERADA